MSAMKETIYVYTTRQHTLVGHKRTFLGWDIGNSRKDDKKSEEKSGDAETRHDGEMEWKEALNVASSQTVCGGLQIQIPRWNVSPSIDCCYFRNMLHESFVKSL